MNDLNTFSRRSLTLAILAGVLCVSGTASAQDPFEGLLGKRMGGDAQRTTQAIDRLMGGDAQRTTQASGPLLHHFQGSYSGLLTAQSRFAEAFGLKDEASKLAAEAKSLGSGPVDASTLEKVKSTSEEAQKLIDAKMAEEQELSVEGKKSYGIGLSSYAIALFEAAKTVEAGKQFAGRAQSNPLGALLGGELGAAFYVIKEVPGYFTNLQASSSMAMSYANRNKIEVPKDATSMLDGM